MGSRMAEDLRGRPVAPSNQTAAVQPEDCPILDGVHDLAELRPGWQPYHREPSDSAWCLREYARQVQPAQVGARDPSTGPASRQRPAAASHDFGQGGNLESLD